MAEREETGQRTEEATPRRREEARDQGQVPLSTELIAALSLIGGLVGLVLGGGPLMETLGELFRGTTVAMAALGETDLSEAQVSAILRSLIGRVGAALGLVVAPALVAGLLVGFLQVGFRIAPKAMEPDLSKVDPIKGLQRLVSLRGAVRTGLAAAKVILISGTVGIVAWRHVDEVVRIQTNELGPLLAATGHIALRCTVAALVVTLLLAVLDLLYQRYQHEKDLRMTRQEVKEDHRQTDGDPHVRARIRSIQREMSMRRMMDDVPKATVVVTNPTHYAVALRYDRETGTGAPVVVAKGVDHLAQRIKEIARAHGVVCYEDVALARALYAQVQVGQEIPEQLYAAVATVLGYVYRLQEARA